ncbi:MAG: TetR/AcrR family transcriptional regulator [Phenylobacterium sp.]|uniref:TetR/AcrR family transcriptional regulator n=1 Tax=Phenylobacterium sp. TaxID=1871053 RepID=UPI001B7B3C2F|nr:TetR/AcrR family transcriptional regulator [Phenylobacterium sp.]MBP7816291.1 TetR/AcrR family transcriptional regulator [Phenylobacterium sp.]MBP9232586.1 TetR/AcrR family transcriptional regulator [Phenylobacterium sp.]MBP9754645.1 TetR/AcrR family transcriptional regulator [Phenylobacterium sp.]
MGKPLRRRLKPEARKLEIVEAAERLLQAGGGARVRVEDVVREAGVAKGTFFLYFPTLDDLLETIRTRIVSEFDMANPLPTEVEGPVDWPMLVESQALAFIEFTLSRRGVGEAVFHSDFAERRPLADHAIHRLTAVIRAGQEAEAFGPVDAEPTARLLYAAIHEAADAVAAGVDRIAMQGALQSLLRRTLAH